MVCITTAAADFARSWRPGIVALQVSSDIHHFKWLDFDLSVSLQASTLDQWSYSVNPCAMAKIESQL